MPTIKEFLQQKERGNTQIEPYGANPAAMEYINRNKQRLINALNDWRNGKERRK